MCIKMSTDATDAGRADWPEPSGVADAGGIMPPKSTWFEPKLLDGLVSHVLD